MTEEAGRYQVDTGRSRAGIASSDTPPSAYTAGRKFCNFYLALASMREGRAIARKRWLWEFNGERMSVAMTDAYMFLAMLPRIYAKDGRIENIVIVCSKNDFEGFTVQKWAPSQEEILADDWTVL